MSAGADHLQVTESDWHQVVVREEGFPAAVLADLDRFFLAVEEQDYLARRDPLAVLEFQPSNIGKVGQPEPFILKRRARWSKSSALLLPFC